jgi:hypothetical protein
MLRGRVAMEVVDKVDEVETMYVDVCVEYVALVKRTVNP